MKDNKSNLAKNSFCKILSGITKIILSFLKKLESLGKSSKSFASFYDRLFYAKLITNEIEIADLEKDDKIVHIGSGPFPITAISLAREGYQITGVDVDEIALKKAEDLTEKLNLCNKINFKLATAEEIDFTKFDVVWMSLHVIPKAETINEIIKKLSPGQKLIYRNPRGLLTFLYDKVEAEEITDNDFIIKRQPLGKESVLIKL